MRRASLTSILTLCHLAALVAAATVVSAAGLPKWDKLSRGYSYDQYLRDIGKERPASAEEHARLSRAMLQAVTAGAEPMRRELDYRRANPPVLTAVKDQGACGSC